MLTSFGLAREAACFSMLNLTAAQSADIQTIEQAMSRAFADDAPFADAPGTPMLLRSDEVQEVPCALPVNGLIRIPAGTEREGSA